MKYTLVLKWCLDKTKERIAVIESQYNTFLHNVGLHCLEDISVLLKRGDSVFNHRNTVCKPIGYQGKAAKTIVKLTIL